MMNLMDTDLLAAQDGESAKVSLTHAVAPWLAGSAIAAGQAFLATGCSVPKVGKCVGCGSCVVAVVSLSAWAIKRRKHTQLLKQQGLEPFEVISK